MTLSLLSFAALLHLLPSVSAETATVNDAPYTVVSSVEDPEYLVRLAVDPSHLPLAVLFGYRSPAGTWKLHSVMERVRQNPDARIREGREPEAARSPNPFSVGGALEQAGIRG